jgi:hypothetical protein
MLSSRLARAALLAIAAAFSFAEGASQTQDYRLPTGCRDSCPTPFSPPRRSVVRLAGGCDVRVTWIARPSCGVGWDLSITRIEPLTDGCGGIDIGRLVDESTDSLIAGDETGFATMAGFRDTCVAVGRVLRAACWGYRVECGDSLVLPCDTSSCCESPVLLCTDEIFRRRTVRGGSVLRAPCDARRACTQTCGRPRDSVPYRDPVDTIWIDPSNFGTLTSRREPDGQMHSSTAQRRARLPAWPWRDGRPVRAPVREMREEEWRLARLAGPRW